MGLAGCGSSQLQATAPRVTRFLGRVPADARALTVTRGYPGHRPSLSATTTDPVKVAKIAAMLDRLHRVRPGIVNCLMIRSAPTVIFAFRTRRSGPVLARASTLASGPHGECPGVAFTVPGRARQGLSAQPAFLRAAGRTLGLTLLTK